MKIRYIFPLILLLFIVPLFGIGCSAQIYEDFSPIFYFESEEKCFPVDASYHIQNSYFYSDTGQLISDNPAGINFDTYSSSELYDSYYLDNIIGSIDDDKIVNHYQKNEKSYGYTVYYREYYDFESSSTFIQYWMFYAFNKGHLNQHEGDWEMVQVSIPDNGAKWVAYSQHYSGQRATWEQVEKEGNHIKVYVARGSHANFLRSYSGKFGIANDFVDSNGKVLRPGDYELISLDDVNWLNYSGRWGELGGNVIESTAKSVLGQAGPRGPQYRLSDSGDMWGDPSGWGESLLEADDSIFMLEWFIYSFVMIFIAITIIMFAITGFLIYRRHKKYGLGPRIVSLLYIDGINLKSIGNIVCIIGIVLIILGLIYPWYQISYDTSALDISEEFKTSGLTELLKIDGVSGIQIVIPGQNGFSPLGTLSIPFSVMFGISLIFLIVITIGISYSKKLGSKYITRGIRFLIPVILIIIVMMTLGAVIPSDIAGNDEVSGSISNILNSVSNSPFGNEQTFNIDVGDGLFAPLKLSWGLGAGAWYLLIGGIVLIISGILEKIANTQFFKTKIPIPGKKNQVMQTPQKPNQPQLPDPSKKKKQKKEKTKENFCSQCGSELEENATFCINCGNRLE